jgi:AraC-like DNA-binding protein
MANLKGTANSFRMTQITERRDFETRGDLLRFFLVKSGETVVRIDRSEEKLLKDGDMLLLNPGESAVFNPQNPAEYAAVLLELDAEWLKGYYSAPFNDFLDALKKGACKLNHLVPARLASSIFFGQDRRMARCQTPEENAAVKGLLLLFLSKLRSRKYYTENETNQDEGFKKVISEYLQKNFADNITAADAAHYSGYTKNYFCVLFKRNFASAFKTYVSRYRVNAALKKIYDGEKDITKIAFDVGFNNVSYFSKVFRQLLDYSPNSIIKAKQQKAAESALLPPARSRKPLAKGR